MVVSPSPHRAVDGPDSAAETDMPANGWSGRLKRPRSMSCAAFDREEADPRARRAVVGAACDDNGLKVMSRRVFHMDLEVLGIMTADRPEVRRRWTRRRLVDTLCACYGTTPAGKLDVDAVAAAFRVTPATVRRWIRGSSGRVAARMPAKRLAQLQSPPAEVVEKGRAVADNARKVVAGLDLPHGHERVRQKQWLEPHLVAIIELPFASGRTVLRQLVLTRGTPRQVERIEKRGEIVDFTIVPSRYHAVVLIDEALQRVQNWRVMPSEELVVDSRTQTFTSDAPALALAPLAQETFPDADAPTLRAQEQLLMDAVEERRKR